MAIAASCVYLRLLTLLTSATSVISSSFAVLLLSLFVLTPAPGNTELEMVTQWLFACVSVYLPASMHV